MVPTFTWGMKILYHTSIRSNQPIMKSSFLYNLELTVLNQWLPLCDTKESFRTFLFCNPKPWNVCKQLFSHTLRPHAIITRMADPFPCLSPFFFPSLGVAVLLI